MKCNKCRWYQLGVCDAPLMIKIKYMLGRWAEMKAFKHKTHTAYEIMNWSVNKQSLIIIKKTGDKLNLKSLLHFWKFYIRIYKNNWFLIVRTPILTFEKFNGSLEIGHPNCYLWLI